MKKLISLMLCLCTVILFSNSAVAKDLTKSATGKFQYEISGVSNGAQGSYLVKVWTYSLKKYADIEECKKNAVHGVLFKGYAGSGNVRPQQPLVREVGAEAKYADFFNAFFANGGEYNKYVTVTMGSQEVVKVGKEYKIGLIVSVSKDQLRKALEAAGVVKALGAGF
ncbi:MAG: hypothetical protein II289_08065 [Bacteroidales bacterium]|nr:hypothetical protein [Bacteroidales bacterium]